MFLAEHPRASDLWELPEWRTVARFPQVAKSYMDQCMAGLRGPRSGLLVKKPTEFVAPAEVLVKQLRALQCDGNHEHLICGGSVRGVPADEAKDMARWPQTLCRRLANGCGEQLNR